MRPNYTIGNNMRTNLMIWVEEDQIKWFREECISISQFVRKCMKMKMERDLENEQERDIFKQKM